MTTLNSTFKTKLAQENKGYESGSESLNIPIPLSRAWNIYHVSTRENFSFDPPNFGQSPVAPDLHADYSPQGYRCHSSIYQRLVFSSSDEDSPVKPSDHHHHNPSTDVSSPAYRRAELSSPVQHNLCHLLTSTTDQFSQMHGMMIPLPLRNTFPQHLWMMVLN